MLPAAPDLPIRAVLGELTDTLRGAGTAVLVAPPGTGKTTLAPLALADAVEGRVLVAEPRRVATRAAARRMAALLGEPVGERVGFAVRGERRVSPATRVEVVTTGLLVRRLLRDEELPGVAAVVLDECHERALDSDLALAFSADVRAVLREDLWLLATSATADVPALTAALSAPVVTASAALHPVTPVWCPPPAAVRPALGLRVDPALLAHVAATVRRALAETAGDVLVFLPGTGEIGTVHTALSTVDAEVLELHGRQPAAAQDAVLRGGPRRRVVLATSVAESSLTVPGVRIVVDAGLARVPRMDLARGLGSLATVPVSRAAAEQRAGRAGREGPGTVYRCWSAAQHERLPARPEPEIAVADLTSFALDLACWGRPDGTGLALPEPPPAGAMAVAGEALTALGAVDARGRVTRRGRALAAVGTHPRLARALLDGAPRLGSRRTAELVALLAEPDGAGTDDLAAARRTLDRDRRAAGWRAEMHRLERAAPKHPATGVGAEAAAGVVAGLAFPERLARRREGDEDTYLMAGGTAAQLSPGSALHGAQWLAIAVADRPVGRAAARIRLAAPIDPTTAAELGAALRHTEERIGWYDGDVRADRIDRLGAITLATRPVPDPAPAAVHDALLAGLRGEGPRLLRFGPGGVALRARIAFCRTVFGEPWPDVSDAGLVADPDAWLGPELARARRRADLARIDASAALRRLLDWRQAAELDRLAPERVTVPSGSSIRVDYTDPAAPVLAVKVQEMFGATDTPRIGAGRVPLTLHLLSPAGRPAAVTSDLASFWRTGYPAVRAELRGRYPRHPWPADPTIAPATRRTNPRRR
ncbi:ATP-dependent helicase [Actinocatenispora thailandica]|uniref:ATP-dependent helicase n=1 Tax=Actinocatenispora thailandica TaxID=227318 RepID=A0A7R7DQG3_9ACTN|nr:ATP-dependent helicase HrpB [Actinocatenispora thailandica]BCJ35909.1 ATP-dependent helicase [Actinocatenispora thailandica]